MSLAHCSLVSLGCVFGFATTREKRLLTALQALKIAQRRLRPEVRATLLGIASSRTDTTLMPEAWRFTFQDVATIGRLRIVTVASEKSSEHPATVEAFAAGRVEETAPLYSSSPIDQIKLQIDSDAALQMLESQLQPPLPVSAQYRLSQAKPDGEPFWTIDFYGPGEAPLATLRLGAQGRGLATT